MVCGSHVQPDLSQRAQASSAHSPTHVSVQGVDKAQLIKDVANALYASKICSYAQGMNIIKHKSADKGWDIDLGALARIWKARTACHPAAVILRTPILPQSSNATSVALMFARAPAMHACGLRRIACLGQDLCSPEFPCVTL